MANDPLAKFEAVMGAISKINVDGPADDLSDARCPQCNASDFVKVSDLYTDAVIRVESEQSKPEETIVAGLTDMQIIARYRPPQRGSPALTVIATAIPLGVGAWYVNWRWGDRLGQGAGIAAFVIIVIVLLTTMRRLSDKHYHQRRRYNSLYLCRKCGQAITSS